MSQCDCKKYSLDFFIKFSRVLPLSMIFDYYRFINDDLFRCISAIEKQNKRRAKIIIPWKIICKRQTLSDDFIRRFSATLDWEYLQIFQTLSVDIICLLYTSVFIKT